MIERMLRLIDSGPGEPEENMAEDEVLLGAAARRPTLRFYAWSRPAISIGYFQRFEPQPFPVVRRLTGGGAILHRDELTFSVAAPIALLAPETPGAVAPRGGVRVSFDAVNRALAKGLARLGIELDPPSSPDPAAGGGREVFFCFARRSPTDLRVRGRKLVGSAQRRRGGAVLHHGCLRLRSECIEDTSITVSEAAGRTIGYDEVAGALAAGFREALSVRLEPAGLDAEERRAVEELARERYGAESWRTRG